MNTTKPSALPNTQSTVVVQSKVAKKASNTSNSTEKKASTSSITQIVKVTKATPHTPTKEVKKNFAVTHNLDEEDEWKTVKAQSYGWSRWDKWNWEDRVAESRRYTNYPTTQSQASSSNKPKPTKAVKTASKPATLAGANKSAGDQKYYLSIPSAQEQSASQKTSPQKVTTPTSQEEQIFCAKEQTSSEWGKPLKRVANSDTSTNADEVVSVKSTATQVVRAAPATAAAVQMKENNENEKTTTTDKTKKKTVKQVKSQSYGWGRWGKWNYEDRIARENEYWNEWFENRVPAK